MTEKTKQIEGRTGAWEMVLGLEVHAQVASSAKLFSGAPSIPVHLAQRLFDQRALCFCGGGLRDVRKLGARRSRRD